MFNNKKLYLKIPPALLQEGLYFLQFANWQLPTCF